MTVKRADRARIRPDCRAVPLKAVVLLPYAGLVAWEARRSVRAAASPLPNPVPTLQAGHR